MKKKRKKLALFDKDLNTIEKNIQKAIDNAFKKIEAEKRRKKKKK